VEQIVELGMLLVGHARILLQPADIACRPREEDAL
jgi:hypothetical protein